MPPAVEGVKDAGSGKPVKDGKNDTHRIAQIYGDWIKKQRFLMADRDPDTLSNKKQRAYGVPLPRRKSHGMAFA
jgi:hypothetical protein